MSRKVANLVINDQAIEALINNPTIAEWLPCMKQAKTKLASYTKGNPACVVCEKKRIAGRASVLVAGKNCLLNSPPDVLVKIKDYLNTNQLQVEFYTAGGSKQVRTC